MFNKLKISLLYGNRFCGIEHTTKVGEAIIVAYVLKKQKSEIITDSIFNEETINNISKKLPKKQHAVLIINNENVLSKTIESEQNDNLKLVYKAFPNINLDDFYFEVSHQNNIHFISLCRKEYIDTIIRDYNNNNISIIDISLGNILIASIADFATTNTITSSNAIIQLDNKKIQSIEKTEIPTISHYNINGLKTSNEDILSFSGALQSAVGNSNTDTNFETSKLELLKTYTNARFFSQFIKLAGLFILAILLVNFLFFNHYFNKAENLKQTSQINQNTKQKIVTLNESVSKKEKMVDDILKSNASKSSYYANSIIQSMPNSITLSSLQYQPLQKRIKPSKKIELNYNTIIITGNSNDKPVFSMWVDLLETKDWINSAEITDYSDISSSLSSFSLKINISND